MTTKEFLKTYGGKLFSKRIEHLDKMEGFENKGYIPTKGSGITIGYGIDLGFQTVDTLVEYGIDRKTAEMWDEKGYLGKLYTDFEIESKKIDSKFKGQTPEAIATGVYIDKDIKNKLAQNIFIKADKALKKYQGKVSDDVYTSLTTLYNFGGGFGKEQKEGFKTPGALKRKSHAVSTVFKSIDKWIKDNPELLVPDRLVNESLRYSQISLSEGAKLIGADSDSNATTLGREANYIEAKSKDIKQEKLENKPTRYDKGDNKIEKKERPDYSDYYIDYKKDFEVKDPLEGVEVDDIEDEEVFPEKTDDVKTDKETTEIKVSTEETEGVDENLGDDVNVEDSDDVNVEDNVDTNIVGTENEALEYDESFLEKAGGLSSLIGLATGAIGLGQALKNVDVPKDPKLGPAFQQRLEESKRLAQQGLTPAELAKAHKDLDSSYATGIDNIVRGSAGNRAQFLAGLGGLDVARQSALMDIAVADAQMQRENQATYDDLMLKNETYEAARESKYQDAIYQQKQATKAAGAGLAGASASMIADSMANRETDRYYKVKTQQMLKDMGYVTDKNGKSGQKRVGYNEQGERADSFLLNPLRAEDNSTKVKSEEINKNIGQIINEEEKDRGIFGGLFKKRTGLINPMNEKFEH